MRLSALITLLLVVVLLVLPCNDSFSQQKAFIPNYVLQGLDDYEKKGYEGAVKTWLTDSPFENAIAMASRINFFKNIEKLYGGYLGYDIVFVENTDTSSRVYVRMNFERTAGYIMFTSLLLNGKWSLNHIDLDRLQKFGSNVK